eukprot:symbB.v1.2.023459.t1/scaffold2145.1/size88005/5
MIRIAEFKPDLTTEDQNKPGDLKDDVLLCFHTNRLRQEIQDLIFHDCKHCSGDRRNSGTASWMATLPQDEAARSAESQTY